MDSFILFICFLAIYGLFGFEPTLIAILSFIALREYK